MYKVTNMHWVIQQQLFKPENYQRVIAALEQLDIDYSSVVILPGTLELEPDIAPTGRVYVCGAIKLKRIALERNWYPGSFLNDNFRFDIWHSKLQPFMLNGQVNYGKFNSIKIDATKKYFIRPLADNKAFDGMVIDLEMLQSWRNDPAKKSLLNLAVVVAPVQTILKEYRLFVVRHRVVTGSVYKVLGQPEVSTLVEPAAIEFANKLINTWAPAESFVLDLALTQQGYRVIEFNNINSSGFYGCNVLDYVRAIQIAYQ